MFLTWPNGQTFFLTSKVQMFDQQSLIVWPGPKATKHYSVLQRHIISTVPISRDNPWIKLRNTLDILLRCSVVLERHIISVVLSILECGSLKDPTDVAFLLDASASLREENFKKEKFFVKKIINNIFPVSPDGNRIGIIQYSTNAKVEVHFDDYFVNTSLIAAIDDIPYSNGQSRIDLGLKLARDDLFKTNKGARRGVRKVSTVEWL